VFVICHPEANDDILTVCNEQNENLSNGNDGFCLVEGTEGVRDTDYTILDCVGDFNGDPGAGWEV
jgi:hypothetical protein